MTIAITREVSRSIARCELTHLERDAIDLAVAREQHADYCRLLEELGCELVRLPEEPELPDSVFVEDVALVFPELAVLTRPGAASRRPEVDTVARALELHRPLQRIEAPATLDGGDVLVVDQDVYVGLSARSSREGVRALGRILAAHGYTLRGVPLRGCLHLKSAACEVAADTLLVNPAWVDPSELGGRRCIEVDPAEPFGANALRVGDSVIHSSSFPLTRARLEAAGIRVAAVAASELAKAEGGVTCCSLLVRSS